MSFDEVIGLFIVLFWAVFGLTYLFLWWFPSDNDFRLVVTVSTLVSLTVLAGMVSAQSKK